MKHPLRPLLALLACLAAVPSGVAGPSYSPYAGRSFPERLLWGDTHLHTNMSADASAFGNSRLGPDDAFRFARGETVTAHNGMALRLARPLDFLVVADHGEYLGVMPRLRAGDAALLATATGKRWSELLKGDAAARGKLLFEWGTAMRDNKDLIDSTDFTAAVWSGVARTADRFDDPGRFTAFAGYEWTSMPKGDNLHRIVMFADDASRVAKVVPFTSIDSDDPEQLWAFLARYEQDTGGRAIAIPHNSNVSGGLMFLPETRGGQPFDRDYATRRARWEPLVEVTQYKGTSETHPLNSPTDDFAGFEIWDRANLGMETAQTPAMQPYQYARSALRIGLAEEAKLGVNPFKFGLIGSTDAHTGFAAAEEGNFWGKSTKSEPAAGRWHEPLARNPAHPELSFLESEMAAAGYVGVWATENTRAAIFAAMQRREVYASSGPRIALRFFAGSDFVPGDAAAPDLAAVGYAKGVPMGADLPPPPAGQAPRFLVAATRDPLSGNLDRIQIVKGWLDANGETRERVYDVAWSGKRKPDRHGKLPAVGDTVDVANATWSNSIGAAELATVWTDPDFDPAERAFWYVRVIEIPTPRWTAYDKRFFAVDMPAGVPMKTQERAYSSPIWYTPAAATVAGR